MAASITVHLQIFKRPQLPHFSTNFDETDIKIHGLLRSFIYNRVIVRDAVPFKTVNLRLVIQDHLGFLACVNTVNLSDWIVYLKTVTFR